jgi:hypothetical protein
MKPGFKAAIKGALIIFSLPLFLHAQEAEPMSDRLTDILKSDIFNVGILLQSNGVFSFQDDDFKGGRLFDLGATRLDVRGLVDNNFLYRFQVDLRRPATVLDAQVGYVASENFRIVAGAYKPYTSRDLDPNPGNTDFMNRARQVRTMMNSREIGVTVSGTPGNFIYAFGMYNGTGLTRSNDNRFMYTSRISYRAELENSHMIFGFTGAINQTRNESVGNTGLISEGNRSLYGPYLEFGSRIFFGTFEFLQTRFNAQNFGGREETITGFYGTLGANTSEKDQLLVRWDKLDFDLRGDTSDLFTLGWNHQATRLISFKVNLWAQFDTDEDPKYGIGGRFQFQI